MTGIIIDVAVYNFLPFKTYISHSAKSHNCQKTFKFITNTNKIKSLIEITLVIGPVTLDYLLDVLAVFARM